MYITPSLRSHDQQNAVYFTALVIRANIEMAQSTMFYAILR